MSQSTIPQSVQVSFPEGDEADRLYARDARGFWVYFMVAPIASLIMTIVIATLTEFAWPAAIPGLLVLVFSWGEAFSHHGGYGRAWSIYIDEVGGLHAYRERVSSLHLPRPAIRYTDGNYFMRLFTRRSQVQLLNLKACWLVVSVRWRPGVQLSEVTLYDVELILHDVDGDQIGWLSIQEAIDFVSRFQSVKDYHSDMRENVRIVDSLGAALSAISGSRVSGRARKLVQAAFQVIAKQYPSVSERIPMWEGDRSRMLKILEAVLQQEVQPTSTS